MTDIKRNEIVIPVYKIEDNDSRVILTRTHKFHKATKGDGNHLDWEEVCAAMAKRIKFISEDNTSTSKTDDHIKNLGNLLDHLKTLNDGLKGLDKF